MRGAVHGHGQPLVEARLRPKAEVARGGKRTFRNAVDDRRQLVGKAGRLDVRVDQPVRRHFPLALCRYFSGPRRGD